MKSEKEIRTKLEEIKTKMDVSYYERELYFKAQSKILKWVLEDD